MSRGGKGKPNTNRQGVAEITSVLNIGYAIGRSYAYPQLQIRIPAELLGIEKTELTYRLKVGDWLHFLFPKNIPPGRVEATAVVWTTKRFLQVPAMVEHVYPGHAILQVIESKPLTTSTSSTNSDRAAAGEADQIRGKIFMPGNALETAHFDGLLFKGTPTDPYLMMNSILRNGDFLLVDIVDQIDGLGCPWLVTRGYFDSMVYGENSDTFLTECVGIVGNIPPLATRSRSNPVIAQLFCKGLPVINLTESQAAAHAGNEEASEKKKAAPGGSKNLKCGDRYMFAFEKDPTSDRWMITSAVRDNSIRLRIPSGVTANRVTGHNAAATERQPADEQAQNQVTNIPRWPSAASTFLNQQQRQSVSSAASGKTSPHSSTSSLPLIPTVSKRSTPAAEVAGGSDALHEAVSEDDISAILPDLDVDDDLDEEDANRCNEILEQLENSLSLGSRSEHCLPGDHHPYVKLLMAQNAQITSSSSSSELDESFEAGANHHNDVTEMSNVVEYSGSTTSPSGVSTGQQVAGYSFGGLHNNEIPVTGRSLGRGRKRELSGNNNLLGSKSDQHPTLGSGHNQHGEDRGQLRRIADTASNSGDGISRFITTEMAHRMSMTGVNVSVGSQRTGPQDTSNQTDNKASQHSTENNGCHPFQPNHDTEDDLSNVTLPPGLTSDCLPPSLRQRMLELKKSAQSQPYNHAPGSSVASGDKQDQRETSAKRKPTVRFPAGLRKSPATTVTLPPHERLREMSQEAGAPMDQQKQQQSQHNSSASNQIRTDISGSKLQRQIVSSTVRYSPLTEFDNACRDGSQINSSENSLRTSISTNDQSSQEQHSPSHEDDNVRPLQGQSPPHLPSTYRVTPIGAYSSSSEDSNGCVKPNPQAAFHTAATPTVPTVRHQASQTEVIPSEVIERALTESDILKQLLEDDDILEIIGARHFRLLRKLM